jgi:hypothetical protein
MSVGMMPGCTTTRPRSQDQTVDPRIETEPLELRNTDEPDDRVDDKTDDNLKPARTGGLVG